LFDIDARSPPGVGKSTLMNQSALLSARRLGKPVSYIRVLYDETQSSFVGESEKFIRILFETANQCQPSIIFLDEVI